MRLGSLHFKVLLVLFYAATTYGTNHSRSQIPDDTQLDRKLPVTLTAYQESEEKVAQKC